MVDELFQKAVNSGRTNILTLNGEPLPEDLALMTTYLRTKGFNSTYRIVRHDDGYSITAKSEGCHYEHTLTFKGL